MRINTPWLSWLYHKGQKKTRQSFIAFFALLLFGCSSVTVLVEPEPVAIIGAQDERIAQTGKNILLSGGNSADAMAGMLMTASVIMPSRAGIGAGGVCQILDTHEGRVKTLDFISKPMSFDGKIATPALPRGMYKLQNEYGHKRWMDVFTDAIGYAEKGFSISLPLANDLETATDLPASWKMKRQKELVKQPELANTLRILSKYGAGVLYNGDLANSIVSQSQQIVREDLKNTKAFLLDSIDVMNQNQRIFFVNSSVLEPEGYAIMKGLLADDEAKIKQAKEDLKKLQERAQNEMQISGMSLLSADKSGLVVVCNVSMGKSFGSSVMTDEGFFLGEMFSLKENTQAFLNMMITNAEITDVEYVNANVAQDALEIGLSSYIDKTIPTDSVSLICDTGFFNQASSCEDTNAIRKIIKRH